MTLSPRRFGVLAVVAGLVAGTLPAGVPERQSLRAGDYWLLSGDFHVHAFPGDGALTPWLLREEAARAGLDVIAITNHNQVFTGRLANWIARRSDGPLMLPGEEITNPRYHMIAVGVVSRVDADQPAASAAADVRARGGVAIAAHPAPAFHGYDADEALAQLDGTEAAHSDVARNPPFRSQLMSFYRRARGIKPAIAAIGSSDFHAMRPGVGSSRTLLFVRERSEAGVIDAIRSGRTLAMDGDGNVQGDDALIALLGDVRPARRSDEHANWRRLAIALAWLGTLAIALCK